ncbi:MAG: PcfJ domain-containing protein, partial [Clostridium sp.]
RYELIAHYIFSLDGCNMIKRDPWFNSSWYETKSIHARNNSLYWDKIQYYIDYDSLDEAIKGTYLQYADYKKFTYDGNNHLLKYLELFSKYPQIEKLNKIGCSNLVRMRLDRQSGTSINFRGKDLWSMLKISKKNFREMQKNRFGPPSMCLIEMYQLKSDSSTLSAKDVEDCSMKYYPDAMKKIIKYTTLDKAYRYLNKQMSKGEYVTHRSVQIRWVDYIEQCVKLKVDLSNKKYLFPSNLEEEHHKTTLKIKLKEDKELDEKIREANKKRDIYNIGYKNLFCRPANSSKELIEEGYELKHCVGGYAQRHAEGGTNILLIRHLDEPDTPFFTLEVDWKGIRQVHGYRNCNPTEEVQEFLDFFKEKILNKRKEVA